MTPTLYATNSGLNVTASLLGGGVSARGGSVDPRLFFQVQLNVSKAPGWHRAAEVQAWSFGVLYGHMRMRNEQFADIKTYSVNTWLWGEQREDDTPKGTPIQRELVLNVEVPLDPRRIDWVERQRAGRSFEAVFHMCLQVELFGKNIFTPSFPVGLMDSLCIEGDIPIVVPDTRWRESVLPALGHGKIFVIELPAVSSDAYSAFDHSLKALNNAQKQFDTGFYDEAAASCRVALEHFFEPQDVGTGKKIPKLKKAWETRLGEATYQWLDTALIDISVNHDNRFFAHAL